MCRRLKLADHAGTGEMKRPHQDQRGCETETDTLMRVRHRQMTRTTQLLTAHNDTVLGCMGIL
jgi:hypothetical protein